MKSVLDLQTIGGAGGGFILDAQRFSTLDLQTIVGAAKGPVILKGLSGKSTLDLQVIAGSGKGRVIFDLSSD